MQNVTVTGPSGCSWPVTASDTWIDVASSSASPGTFAIGVDRNDGSRRMGTVTFGAGGIVTVTQDPVTPPPCPTMPRVSSTSVRLGGSVGATATVRLQEAERCRYEVSENLTWLGAAPSPVAGDALVTFTADEENDTGAGRPGTVMIGGVGGRAVTVTQDPVTPPPCPTMPRVSSTSVRLGGSVGATATVRLQEAERCRYEVSENLTWLGAAPSPVAGDALVTFTADEENDTGAERTGTVRFGASRIVTVIQERPDCSDSPTGVTPTRLTFTSAAGSRNVTVAGLTGCSWPVRASDTWINVVPPASPGSFAIGVDRNDGPRRTGTVRFGASRIVTVIQERPDCSDSPTGVTPTPLTFTSSAGTRNVRVAGQSGCSWPVSDDRTWITTPSSVSVGDMTVTVEASTDTRTRSGTVTIGTGSGGLTVTVTQEPLAGPVQCPDAPTVSSPLAPNTQPVSLPFGYDRNRTIVTVREDASCSYTVSADPDWIAVDPLTVAGNGAVTVQVEYNSDRARNGTVSIGSTEVTVTQDPEPVPPGAGTCRYGVFPDFVKVSNERGQGAISVSWEYAADEQFPPDPVPDSDEGSGCVSWVATAPASWISVSKFDANTAKYTIDPNPTTPGREGQIKIGDRRIGVIQGLSRLTQDRDRLLRDWVARRNKGSVCDAWNALVTGEKDVFLWNTHRLHVTNMLQHVSSVTG